MTAPAICAIVTAHKMIDSEEIEGEFQFRVEELDKEFLSSFQQSGLAPSVLEKQYRERLQALINEYREKFRLFLDSKREVLETLRAKGNVPVFEKEKEEGALDMSHPFTVVPLELRLSRKERLHVDWDLYSFKKRLAFRRFTRRHLPSFVVIIYFHLRIWGKLFYNAFLRRVYFMKRRFMERLSSFVQHVKSGFDVSLAFLKKVIAAVKVFILERVLRRKIASAEPQSEDAKIAAKLLDKKSPS